MKIIDKIKQALAEEKPFFSFEYFPPKTDAALENLYGRLDRMARLEPAFVDVTWGAGGSTSDASLGISTTAQREFGLEVMMHLTCTHMTRAMIDQALTRAREGGLSNILALRGDPPEGSATWQATADGFRCAAQLVRYIRTQHGDHFGIAVGAYPEAHIEATSKAADINYLKAKVDEGADFIVTQLFYDMAEYDDFLEQCARVGISCPIIPGVMPIQNYERFLRFTELAKTKIPAALRQRLESLKDDDEAIKAYGIDLAVEMGEKVLARGAPGIHFYTLNLESAATQILDRLGLLHDVASRRALPWRPSTLPQRQNEDVRPIFWSNRPRSYLARTMDWDAFPTGRWSDSRSPTFGDLDDYYLSRRGGGIAPKSRREKSRKLWGEPTTMADVNRVFVDFCQGKIPRLPWCESSIRAETGRIADALVALNQRGVLTINSQPQVNAAQSTEPDVGWGGEGGYVFQKAYLECFIAPDRLQRLVTLARDFPSLTYHAVNAAGASFANVTPGYVNAVTWGVFPGKQILQPTIVDAESFAVWKDEAFHLWHDEWASLYADGSASQTFLRELADSTFLMSLVENDFIHGDIFAIFERLFADEG